MTETQGEKPKYHFNLHHLFPTKVLSTVWDDHENLNERVKAAIWKNRALDPEGLYRSNLSGTWHSKDNLLETIGDVGKEVARMFGIAMTEWAMQMGCQDKKLINLRMQAWAMVYSDRGYATVHTHPNCHVSGVYYVDVGPETEAITTPTGVRVSPGSIEFVDTRRGGGHQLKDIPLNPSAHIKPQNGQMLIFPSELPHFVHPVVGEGERISIACNGTFVPAPKKG